MISFTCLLNRNKSRKWEKEIPKREVWNNCHLNLIKTVSKSVSTASNRCHMLCKLTSKMSRKTATLLYKQTIMPVLEYCGFLYNGLIQAQHKRLQYVQNRCLRICLNVRLKYCIENLHLDTNVDLLCIRFDTQLLTLLHKYLYGGKHDASDLGLYFEESGELDQRTLDCWLIQLVLRKVLGEVHCIEA